MHKLVVILEWDCAPLGQCFNLELEPFFSKIQCIGFSWLSALQGFHCPAGHAGHLGFFFLATAISKSALQLLHVTLFLTLVSLAFQH